MALGDMFGTLLTDLGGADFFVVIVTIIVLFGMYKARFRWKTAFLFAHMFALMFWYIGAAIGSSLLLGLFIVDAGFIILAVLKVLGR